MGEDTRTGGPAMTSSDPDQLEREIEQTREQLGDTVEALAEKADVKRQAKRKLDETKATVTARADELRGKARQATPDDASAVATAATQRAKENPVPVAAIGAFVVGFIAGRITKRSQD